MGEVLLLSLLAAFNPTLLAASTLMLLLPSPKRLLFGYLIGAYVTSLTLGMVIVFSLQDSGAVGTQKHTVNPAIDLALGAILLLVAFVVGTGRQERLSERRGQKKAGKPKKEPRWRRMLSKGSARDTFVVGALLTLPGGSYIAGLSAIDKQDLPTAGTVGMVILFNVIMLMLLEIPLLGYLLAPDRTPDAVRSFREFLSRRGGRIAVIVALVLGLALIARGLVELLG